METGMKNKLKSVRTRLLSPANRLLRHRLDDVVGCGRAVPMALEIADYVALPITGLVDGKGQTDGCSPGSTACREEPGGANRFFIYDLNGPVYIVPRHNWRPGQRSLTCARMPAILQTMGAASRTIGALGSALSARRDLLLEILALRHQLGVLARSDRRFAYLTVCSGCVLRRLWPRWREALVAGPAGSRSPVGTATGSFDGGGVGRDGGREDPRVNSKVRALIRRMAVENRLWGAPRIHGRSY